MNEYLELWLTLTEVFQWPGSLTNHHKA